MSLYKKIDEDIKNAMKSSDKERLSVLRMFKSAMQVTKKNQQDELSDEEVIAILRKQVKVRKESMNEYLGYKREDLAKGLEKEIEILNEYLPEELSLDNINKILDEVFLELKPESIKDMGKVMKAMTEKIGTGADMSVVSQMVRKRFS